MISVLISLTCEGKTHSIDAGRAARALSLTFALILNYPPDPPNLVDVGHNSV